MTSTLERTFDDLADLVERGLAVGTSMLDSLARSQTVTRLQSGLPRAGSCSCHIPPPCWMPREHRPVTTHVCACGAATLRLRITNCGIENDKVTIAVTGKDGAKVAVSPSPLSLRALERGIVSLKLTTDAADPKGTEYEVLLWVRGCVEHVVRWTVKVAGRGGDACDEIDIEDCPDFVHHWYDHFYCARPCGSESSRG
jgi:hypothetical protein